MRQCWVIFIFTGLVLTGCVAPPLSLSPELQKTLGSVQAVVYVPQSNLDIDVTPGNPGATGLLGALLVAAIDERRRTTARGASLGLTDAARDFNFRTRMGIQLTAEFARVKSVRLVTPITVENTDSESQRRIAYDLSTSSAVLMSNVKYKLISGKIVLIATNVMYPKAANLATFRSKPNGANPLDVGNAVYRKTFMYVKEGVNADNIKAGLNEGIANIAWQIAADINHMRDSSAATTVSALPAPLQPVIAIGLQETSLVNRKVFPSTLPPTTVAGDVAQKTEEINDAERVPYLTERGRLAYQEFLTRPFPRAFAVEQRGYQYGAWGNIPRDPAMPVDVSARALEGCRRAAGSACRLYMVNDKVVWGL